MDKVNRFVEIFQENYNRLYGEERKIDKPVIESIAAAMLDLLDQSDKERPLTEKAPLTFNTGVHNHYHPQSDQILRAVGSTVIIESRDDAIACQQSGSMRTWYKDTLWEPASDPTPRPEHYKILPEDAVFDKVKFDVGTDAPYTLYEDGKPKGRNFDSITEAHLYVAKTDGAMDVVDASLGDYVLKNARGQTVWHRPARSM